MARNIRWFVSFKSRNGTTCRVNIYDNDWPEGVTLGLCGAADPFFYEENNSDDLLNDVIRYRTGYIRVIEQTYGALDDIYPTNTFDRYVEFLYGGTVVFNGYIQVQDFGNTLEYVGTNSTEQCPHVVEFPVISPLGLFEQRTFTPITPPTTKTLGQLLDIALYGSTYTKVVVPDINGIGLWQTLFSLVVSPWNKEFHHSMTTAPLQKVMNPQSYAYLIEGICKAFGWICHDTPQDLVFTSFGHYGIYCSYPVGHIGVLSYKQSESVGTSAVDVTDYYTLADINARRNTLLPDTGIEISYDGSLSTIDFSFDRTTLSSIATHPLFSPEDGERWSVCSLQPVPDLFEISGGSDVEFDNEGRVNRGPHCVAWNGRKGMLYSLFGDTDVDGQQLFKIRLYYKMRNGDSWAISFDGMASGDGSGNLYNSSIGALTNDKKVTDYYVQAEKDIHDDYVEVTFTYHFSDVSGSSYPHLPAYTLLFIHNIRLEYLESGEPYSDIRFLPASEADTIPTTGYPKVSSSITMPFSLYRLNDRMIGSTLFTSKVTEYPYLLQKRLELVGNFRIAASYSGIVHAAKWSYLGKTWRIIAQSFHPWNNEYELTMQHSPVLDANIHTITANASNTSLAGFSDTVLHGGGFSHFITADSGYTLTSVVVQMGSSDITSSAYNSSTGQISIASVTDNVSIVAVAVDYIVFEDSAVKALCVNNWGGNVVAGEITPAEAALVTSLDGVFAGNSSISKFNELRYFIGLTSLYKTGTGDSVQGQFYNCSSLTEITLPAAPITDFRGAFRYTAIANLDLTPTTATLIRMDSMVQGPSSGTTALRTVKVPGVAVSALTRWFKRARGVTTIEIVGGTLDLSRCSSLSEVFANCSALTTITGSIANISASLGCSACPLTVQSALVILNGLAPVSGYKVTFKSSEKSTYEANSDFNNAVYVAQGYGWTVEYA